MTKSNLINGCVFFLILFRLALGRDDISGYYWRDFTGTVPYDAVPGGIENGHQTYVGQALFKELIVPAKIVPEEKIAYFEWGFAVHSATENVKVLCTTNKDYIKWTTSSTSTFEKITDKHFIVAGYEPGGTLYVGRQKNDAKDVILGKLLFNKDGAVLHSVYRGASIMHWEFEVLYFEPFLKKGNKPVANTNKDDATCNCNKKLVNLNLFC